MKKVLCILAIGAMGFVGVGCSTNTTPQKPETFAPLPTAAPGGQGSTPKANVKKNDNRASAMQPES